MKGRSSLASPLSRLIRKDINLQGFSSKFTKKGNVHLVFLISVASFTKNIQLCRRPLHKNKGVAPNDV